MPHTKNRGARKPSTYNVKMAKKQANQTLREQQNLARHIVSVNAFHDRVIGERVNVLPQDEIIRQVTITYPTAPPEAIPTVQDGSVLTVPNKYQLELFPDCNQAAIDAYQATAEEDLELAEEFAALENDAALTEEQ